MLVISIVVKIVGVFYICSIKFNYSFRIQVQVYIHNWTYRVQRRVFNLSWAKRSSANQTCKKQLHRPKSELPKVIIRHNIGPISAAKSRLLLLGQSHCLHRSSAGLTTADFVDYLNLYLFIHLYQADCHFYYGIQF